MNRIFLLYNSGSGAPEINDQVRIFKERLKEILDSRESKVDITGSEQKDQDRIKAELKYADVVIALFNDEIFGLDFYIDLWELACDKQKEKCNQILFPVEFYGLTLENKRTGRKADAFVQAKDNIGFYPKPKDISYNGNREGRIATVRSEDEEFSNFADLIFENLPEKNGNRQSMGISTLITGYAEKLSYTELLSRDELSDYIKSEVRDLEDKVKLQEVVKKVQKVQNKEQTKRDVVCAIYTGGTVGMIRSWDSNDPSGLRQARPEELISKLPRLQELAFDVHLYSYSEKKLIDSSNINSSYWEEIAKIIDKLYTLKYKPSKNEDEKDLYSGFVIIHGANTLAYTASALSYLLCNLDKPIVLTGAEYPLSDISREAETNVIKSLKIAAADAESRIPEVCILYGQNLMRGNRATKKIAIDEVHGFHSPNYHPLASITNDRGSVNFALVRTRNSDTALPFEFRKDVAENLYVPGGENQDTGKAVTDVAIIDVYPDMNLNFFEILGDKLTPDALILRTYGTGGAPEGSRRFLDVIERLKKRGVVIVSLTQSPIGGIEFRLHETNTKLFDRGVISGGDMTTEAAYTKLKYLFAVHKAKDNKLNGVLNPVVKRNIEDDMTRNIAGEITMQTRQIYFDEPLPLSANTPKKTISERFSYFQRRHLVNVVLRIRDIRLEGCKEAMTDEDGNITNCPNVRLNVMMAVMSGNVSYKSLVNGSHTLAYSGVDEDGMALWHLNIDITSNFKKEFSLGDTKQKHEMALDVEFDKKLDIDSMSIVCLLEHGEIYEY